jgi:hypothetical protein
MVFLGGAVLANIVSRNSPLPLYINSQCADGGQGGHVDIKGGVAGAGLASTREAGRTISLTRNLSNSWTSITIELWRSKAILPNPASCITCQICVVSFFSGPLVLQHGHGKILVEVHINE